MNLNGLPWTALMAVQLQRGGQIAWFVYGWIEREHVLNVTAWADWWMRATGFSAVRLEAPRLGIGQTVPPVAPEATVHGGDRAEIARFRYPGPVKPCR